MNPRRLWAWLPAALLAVPGVAHAGGPLGPNGAPVETSNYALDLHQGVVLAGTRVTGLAGAYVAIAEDVDGDLSNPAAPAVRPLYSVDYFDWWLGLGLTLPSSVSNLDYFNSGDVTHLNSPKGLVFLTPAINLQWGDLGAGLTMELQTYEFASVEAEGQPPTTVTTRLLTSHAQFAYSFIDDQLVLGVGHRYLVMTTATRGDRLNRGGDFVSDGSGVELGALFKPNGFPLRFGASWRNSIQTDPSFSDAMLPDENGDITLDDGSGGLYYFPKAAKLPWDLKVGFAWQIGARPFNQPFRAPEDVAERKLLSVRLRELDLQERRAAELSRATTRAERKEIDEHYEARAREIEKERATLLEDARWALKQELAEMERFYLLLSTEFQVAGDTLAGGSSGDLPAIGVESFLSQTVNRSGARATFSPRIGLESEVWPDLVKVRGGTYLEDTRFETSNPRVHWTAGLDLRLIPWDVFGIFPSDYLWRASLSADVSQRYASWGVAIGGWYPRQSGTVERGR